MKKWIQSYRAQGHEEKVTEGTKSLRLLTDSESGVSQLSYIVAKMKELRGFHDRYSLQVDIPEQWRIEQEKTPDAAATAQGAE